MLAGPGEVARGLRGQRDAHLLRERFQPAEHRRGGGPVEGVLVQDGCEFGEGGAAGRVRLEHENQSEDGHVDEVESHDGTAFEL